MPKIDDLGNKVPIKRPRDWVSEGLYVIRSTKVFSSFSACATLLLMHGCPSVVAFAVSLIMN